MVPVALSTLGSKPAQAPPSLSWSSLFRAQCSHRTDSHRLPFLPSPLERLSVELPPWLLIASSEVAPVQRTGTRSVFRLMDFFRLKVTLPDYPSPSPSFAELVVIQNPLAKPTEGTFVDGAVCGRYIAFMF